MKLYDYQQELVDNVLGELMFGSSKILVWSPMASGKEQPYSEPVFANSKWITMGELKVGDKIIGEDGTEANILYIFEQGKKDVYEIFFTDGTSVRCGLEHLWKVYRTDWRTNKYKVLQLKDFIEYINKKSYNKQTNKFYTKKMYRIPLTKPIKFKEKKLPLHPYLLGVLLEDGTFRGNTIGVSNSNLRIRSNIQRLLPYGDSIGAMHKKKDSNTYDFTIISGKSHLNTIKQSETMKYIKKSGLYKKYSHEKFIPKEYLTASVKQRMYLLKGLLDTDGYLTKRNKNRYYKYSTSSKQLANDVEDLARGLGLYVVVKSRIPTYTYKGGKKNGKRNYRLYIDFNKKYKTINRVEKKGVEKQRCIYVDNKSHTYLTKHYTVTHNTLQMCSLAIQSGMKCVISVSISDLLSQFDDTMKRLNFDDYSIVKADYGVYDLSKRVLIVMDNTFDARIEEFKGIKADILIQEECHIRMYGDRFKRMKSVLDPDAIVGFTGTPYTKENTFLKGFDTVFKAISMKELIEQGKLTKPKYLLPGWAARKPVSNKSFGEFTKEELQDELNEIHRNKVINTYLNCICYFDPMKAKSVWFTSNVESAEAYAIDLRAKGIEAYAYHGKMKKELREAIMDSYLNDTPLKLNKNDITLFNYKDYKKDRYVRALVSINTLTVGWDSPSTQVEIQCNRTNLLQRKYQIDARVYRFHPNIKDKFILDCGNNLSRLGFAYDEFEAPVDINEARKMIKEIKLEHIEVVCKDESKIYEISRESYNKVIENIKADKRPMSQMSVDEKIDKFFIEDDISELVLLYFGLFKDLYGDPYMYEKWNPQTQKNELKEVKSYYKESSIDWVLEPWIKAFNNYPEMKNQWIKSFKTKARSLLRKPGNVYAIRFFINWLIENEIDKHSECYFYIDKISKKGFIYKYQLNDNELIEISIDEYKKYISKDYNLSLNCEDNIEDLIEEVPF